MNGGRGRTKHFLLPGGCNTARNEAVQFCLAYMPASSFATSSFSAPIENSSKHHPPIHAASRQTSVKNLRAPPQLFPSRFVDNLLKRRHSSHLRPTPPSLKDIKHDTCVLMRCSGDERTLAFRTTSCCPFPLYLCRPDTD